MSSGAITGGFTVIWNDMFYYAGGPLSVWVPYDPGMSAYYPATGYVGFQIPSTSMWLPDGEGLRSLQFTAPAGNDGYGWQYHTYIRTSSGDTGGGAGYAGWSYGGTEPLRPEDVDAMAIKVYSQWIYGGRDNTFSRLGHSSYAQGGGWFGPWTLTWTGETLPVAGQQMIL